MENTITQVKEMGEILNIKITDFIIFNKDGFYSQVTLEGCN